MCVEQVRRWVGGPLSNPGGMGAGSLMGSLNPISLASS